MRTGRFLNSRHYWSTVDCFTFQNQSIYKLPQAPVNLKVSRRLASLLENIVYRPYAKMVSIHFCCLVKFLKTLLLTLENLWNNMLQLEFSVSLAARLQISDSVKFKRSGKSHSSLPSLVCMFLVICPCNLH